MPDIPNTAYTDTGILAFFMAMIVWVLVVALICHLYFGFCFKRMAEKSGHEETAGIWWIPVANFLIPLRIAGKPGIWLLLWLIPVVNVVIAIIVFMADAEELGKENWWGIIAALFPIIGLTYLAFSDATPNAATTG